MLETNRDTVDIRAYSDGSTEGHERSSWGLVLQRNGEKFEKDQGFLHGNEVYDAEIVGATMVLEAAILARHDDKKIFVMPDNQTAVGAL